MKPPANAPRWNWHRVGVTGQRVRVLEGCGLLVLMLLAAALRLWNLWDIPGPTDELLSVKRGLLISRGQLFPLTDFEPYIGALWSYLLALGFLITGPNQYVSRVLPLLVGVLTVPATYLMAREMAGRAAGWVAALLLATSSAHILATSHPAWSHCLVPLFATLGLWQLQRGLRQHDGRGLLAGGFWLGMALQAHLTALALLPGVALYLAWKGRAWLRTPWPYLAAGVGLLLIANILAFNLQSGFETLRRAEAVRAAYARPKGSGLELYVGNLERIGVATLRVVSGAIDMRLRWEDYLFAPTVILPAGLALSGLVILVRRGKPLAALVILSYAGLLVIFNAKYEVIPNGRFLSPLLPLAFAGTGTAFAAAWDRLRSLQPISTACLAVILLELSGVSIIDLGQRYRQMAASARATAALQALVDGVEAARQPDEAILLDRNLDRLWLDGGGDVWMALDYELTRRRVPVEDLPGRVVPPLGDINPCDRQQLVAVRVDLERGAPAWLAPSLGPTPASLPQRFLTFRVLPSTARVEPFGLERPVVFDYQPPLAASSRTVDRCAPGRPI